MTIAQFRLFSTWFVKDRPAHVHGTAGDILIVADYNGDFKAEIAVYRPTATRIKGQTRFSNGNPGDKPAVVDYNGDGKADIAVFLSEHEHLYIKDQDLYAYGAKKGDIPPWLGLQRDGKADIAIFRPSTAPVHQWAWRRVCTGGVGDILAVGDLLTAMRRPTRRPIRCRCPGIGGGAGHDSRQINQSNAPSCAGE